MENLEHFTLARLKQLLEQQDAQTVQHFISQNFAVARHVNAAKFQIAFGHEPVVVDDMRILIVVQGQGRPVINLIERHFQAPELVYLGPNGLVQFHEISPDAQVIGLSISNEFLSLVLGSDIPKAFDGHLRDFHFRLQPDELQLLDRLHLLICESVHLATPNLPATMRLIAAFLWLVDGLWSSREDEERTALSREQRLFADFMQLVAQHAAHEHHISYYASQLCLSPRYMSSIINKVSGKPAKQWIDEAIIARIMVALRHTDKPVAQIADEMNFANTSFFTKYFKRMTGLSPMQWRNQGR